MHISRDELYVTLESCTVIAASDLYSSSAYVHTIYVLTTRTYLFNPYTTTSEPSCDFFFNVINSLLATIMGHVTIAGPWYATSCMSDLYTGYLLREIFLNTLLPCYSTSFGSRWHYCGVKETVL